MYLEGAGLLPAVDRALQLLLVHARAALDAHVLGLVVELLLRASLLPVGTGAKATAAARRHVLARQARGGLRLAGAGALLVDGARGDFLGALRRRTLLLLAVHDVLVLALAFRAPGLLRHVAPFVAFALRVPIRARFNPRVAGVTLAPWRRSCWLGSTSSCVASSRLQHRGTTSSPPTASIRPIWWSRTSRESTRTRSPTRTSTCPSSASPITRTRRDCALRTPPASIRWS